MHQPLVSIQCLVYNHENYLRKCLDGIIAQKTNFSFEIIVHDDASTDHSQDIIREYKTKFPNIVKPIYERENQYSKGEGKLIQLMAKACKGKYIALCEGDDFWIDPLKLQKQIDFLEAHQKCSMVCSRTKLYSEQKRKYIGEIRNKHSNGYLSPQKVIMKGGLYIATVSIVYRKEIRNLNYPSYCLNCVVGDYPLQIMASMKGKIYYFDEAMAAYRVENPISWIGRNKQKNSNKKDYQKKIIGLRSELKMLKGFAEEYPQYRRIFYRRINFYMISLVHKNMESEYYDIFKKELADFLMERSLLWRIGYNIRMHAPRIYYEIWKLAAKIGG